MTANLQRLKRRASDFEQKKQLDRAVELYTQFLDEAGRDIPDDDIPLFNRVGDLLVRRGEVSEALAYYERAVDMYAERGFLNNAIALCSKILRQSPGRATVYYKLGKISARKGFKSDARKNFLEYADRMQKAGQLDEAFRALKEFASLFPDQDDIRLMLADLLSRENRKDEALEQLQALHEKLESEGRSAEARATIDRMKAIDPDVQPRVSGVQVAQQPNALVFLDVTGAEPSPRREPTPLATPVQAPPPGLAPALDGLRITFVPDEEPVAAASDVTDSAASDPAAAAAPDPAAAPEDGQPSATEPPRARPESRRPEWTGDFDLPEQLATVDLDLPVEPAAASADSAAAESAVEALRIDGFEATALADSTTSDAHDASQPETQETPADDARDVAGSTAATDGEPAADADEAQPLSTSAFAELPLTEVARAAAPRRHDLALPTALPHLGERGDLTTDTIEAPIPVAGVDLGDDDSLDSHAIDEAEAEPRVERPAADAPGEARADDLALTASPQSTAAPLADAGAGDAFAAQTVEEASAIDLDDLLAAPPSFGQTPREGTSLFPPLAGLTPDSPSEDQEPAADLEVFKHALDVDVDSAEAEERVHAGASATAPLETMPGSGHVESAVVPDATHGPEPTPSDAPHRTTPRHPPTPRAVLSLGGAEDHLRQRVELEPENWSLRRRLGEALLDAGDREGGLYELELALVGFELEGDLDRATETADVITRVLPGSVRHHQKRVEYAVRAKDRVRLIGAYLELADALFRTGASEKSVAVYARVAELDQDNERAVFALATLAPDRLLALRGGAAQPGRWSDELAAIDNGEALPPSDDDAATAALAAVGSPVEPPSAPPALPDDATAVEAPNDSGAEPARDEAPEPRRHSETLESIEAFAPDEPDAVDAPAAQTAPPAPLDAPALVSPGVDAASEPREPEPPIPPALPIAPAIETPAVLRAIGSGTNGNSAPPPPSVPARERAVAADTGQSGFVDLGEWLRETEPEKSTRMVVEDTKPTGDEQADFAEMLSRFKRGLADNVDAEDFAAHYDLGVAFKEMGLIDEAIAEFQKSLRGAEHRVRSYEALGQCFVEKGQYPIAAALLQRAIETPGTDDQQLVGVLYLLGFACEHLGRHADALRYYQRVFAVDIEFRDVAQRVSSMEHLTK